MRDTLVLGVNLGLSGVRAGVMDHLGRILAATDRHPIPTETGGGRAEQDPSDWLLGVGLTARSALGTVDAGHIEAICVSALGPAPVLVTDDLDALTPALLFSLDRRAEEQRRKIAAKLGLTNSQLNHDHAIPKLLWWRDSQPTRWAQATWALDAAGFIVSHLTGTPTMDTITACDYTLDGMPCPIALPQARNPLSIAGGLSGLWANRLGLAPGVPVLTGTYDSYADTAATGTLSIGSACIIFGSTLIVGVAHPAAPSDLMGLVASPHLGEGVLVGGWTSTGGSAMDWARRIVGVSRTRDDDLEKEAMGLSPGSGGVVFLPYLSGERSPVHDHAARGLLLGLTAETTTAQIYRAVMDGIILSIRDHTERLAAIGGNPSRWRAGGGGSRSRALIQSTSDAIRAPIELVADASLPIGPCRLALRGIGYEPAIVVAELFEPNEFRSGQYEQLYQVYRSLYTSLSRQMHKLTNIDRSNGAGQ
jgi:xylulokinase